MDVLDLVVEGIAGELGPKWTQFFTRLELHPRYRYKIVTNHDNKPDHEKYKCCVRDAVSFWRSSKPVSDIENEIELARRLLCVLMKVQGFESRAVELGKLHGITALPEVPLSQGSLCTSQLPALSKPVEVTVKHPVAELGVAKEDSASSALGQVGMDNTELELDSEPCRKPTAEHWRDVLKTPIDLRVTTHKFAILDLAQRLSIDSWEQLAGELDMSRHRELMQKLSTEKAVEEKFYKLLKEWVQVKNEEATYAALHNAVEACDQRTALSVVRRRFMTCTI